MGQGIIIGLDGDESRVCVRQELKWGESQMKYLVARSYGKQFLLFGKRLHSKPLLLDAHSYEDALMEAVRLMALKIGDRVLVERKSSNRQFSVREYTLAKDRAYYFHSGSATPREVFF